MARWKLATAHYLNCPDTEWEHNETDLITGKALRKRYVVPKYLNPVDPGDCNRDGDCVVCYEGKGLPRDHVFLGDPTPDMIPLDEEAENISATYQERWAYKPDTTEANFSQSIIDRWNAKPEPVQVEGLPELVAA